MFKKRKCDGVFFFIFFVVLVFAAPDIVAQTKRILLMGDSWAEGMWVFGGLQKVLDRYGFNHCEVEGRYTAIGGTKAERWAVNWKGHLDILKEELEKYPSIDIVVMFLGGNDFLSFAMSKSLDDTTPEERQSKWEQICSDLRIVIDYIKSIRPTIKILLCDYDYLDPDRMYATFKLDFHGVSARTLNEALVELAHYKKKLIDDYPDCGYVQNFGLMHYVFGYPQVFFPGHVPRPGVAPLREPFCGGNIAYTSSAEAMPDGVHPSTKGYLEIAENCFHQFIKKWLLSTPYE